TALHLAAASGNVDTLKFLLDKGADVNAREAEWGQTPLMFAAAQNRPAAIALLLKRGADAKLATKTVDIQSFSALDRAALQRQQKVPESFTGKDAKVQPTASQMQAAVQAGRALFAPGKVPPPSKDDPPPRNFNPEEINPPVASKGGL